MVVKIKKAGPVGAPAATTRLEYYRRAHPASSSFRRTRREQIEFDARRLHTLLLFVEHARNPEERVASGESVFRALRRYLSQFHQLESYR